MDIKAKIEEIIEKVKNDSSIQEKFKSDPEGTVKGLVGEAADNETISKIIEAVKNAIGGGALDGIKEKISDALGGILGKKDE